MLLNSNGCILKRFGGMFLLFEKHVQISRDYPFKNDFMILKVMWEKKDDSVLLCF
jgi:hypothetical protein